MLDGDGVPVTPNEFEADADDVADDVLDGVFDGEPVEVGVDVPDAVTVAIADCDGVDDDGRTYCGTGATPRNTVPADAVAMTVVAAVDGTYRYSVVDVVAYSTNTPDSARPASE